MNVESNSHIPDHWEDANIGDIAQMIPGNSPPGDSYNKEGEGVPLINGPDEFRDHALDKAKKIKFTTEPTKRCKKGDVLLCVRGSTTGRMNLAGFDACIGRGVAAIRASDRIEQSYLNYFIHSQRDHIFALGSGSTFPSVSTSDVEGMPIPLPPLPEQRRIVAKIEELFSNLDAGMDDLRAAGQQLERYRLSVLQAAVEGRLTADWRRTHDPEPADQLHDQIQSEKKQLYDSGEIRKPKERPAPEEDEIPFSIPERWSWIRITELMYNWRSGLEKRNSEQGPELEYPYIKMGDITNDGRLTLDSVTRVDAEPEDVEKYELSRGDFLFNVRNSKKLVGKSCVFDVESDEAYLFNNNILRVDFGEKVSTKYINYWFCSAAGRDMLEELKSSTTNVAAIYHKNFFTCIVPLPPLAEQKQIVNEVERLLSVADDAAVTADREHTRAERLRQSILKQAFSGRLVPHEKNTAPLDVDSSSFDGQASSGSGDTGASSDEDEVIAEELYNGGDPGTQIEMDL